MDLNQQIPLLPLKPLSLPAELKGLERLSYNFRWSWQPSAMKVFQKMGPEIWAKDLGPVEILRSIRDFGPFLSDSAFMQEVQTAVSEFDAYMGAGQKSWYSAQKSMHPTFAKGPIAYFCAEYGLHESFTIYSGGLGILAGDHCKEASDLALPFVAVGLFYRSGFFKQMVDGDGRQEHHYPPLDPSMLPLQQVADPKNPSKPLIVDVQFPGRVVHSAVWLAQVGRNPLLLLDTDLPENRPEDRPISGLLYVSSREMRLYQEMVLGFAGVRALQKLGISPSVWHSNEGHSAFMLLERMRQLSIGGMAAADCIPELKRNSVFTIHTPVPAGNERFWAPMVKELTAEEMATSTLKIDQVLALGLGADKDPNFFDMTALCLRLCQGRNGVSLLHGKTADDTWRKVTGSEVIGVTNGVHMPTWLSENMKTLFSKNGADFSNETGLKVAPTGIEGRMRWEAAESIDSMELWQAHMASKKALCDFAGKKMALQHARQGQGPSVLKEVTEGLNPDAFIIGFARRFATYKRASLIFSDEKRLLKLLNNPKRPVQIVFAGKAHPADKAGQKLIAKIYQQTRSERFRGKVFFIEEYNINVGKHLTQGVDIWLNNPRRPLEASGTSGMKAAANGVPNVSILDGWWDEAWDEKRANGWAIGDRTVSRLEAVQDKADAAALYHLLESTVVPLYFDRNANGVSEGWLRVMKNSIASCSFDFSMARMLHDYMHKLYLPAAQSEK